jgi:hypothetical protein
MMPRPLSLFVLLLIFAQGSAPGMDAFSTPWIANLTEEPVEVSLLDSKNNIGSFQLGPGKILQYTVGPEEILSLSVVRPFGRTQSYDQTSLERLRLRASAQRDYLLILPDSVEFVSKKEFKSRLSAFKHRDK